MSLSKIKQLLLDDHLNEALRLIEDLHPQTIEVGVLKSNVLLMMNELDEAENYIFELENNSIQKSKSETISIQIEKARLYLFQKRFNDTINTSDLALDAIESEDKKYFEFKIDANLLKAEALMNINKITESIIICDDELVNAKEIGKPHLIGKCYYAKAQSLSYAGDVRDGLLQFKKSLEYFYQSKNISLIAHALNDLIVWNGFIWQFKESIKYGLAIQEFTKSLYNREMEIISNNWIGYAYSVIGLIEKSNEMVKYSLKLSKEHNYLSHEAVSYMFLGLNYRELGNSDKELENIIKCYQIRKSLQRTIGNAVRFSYSIYQIIISYTDKNEYNNAKPYFEELKDLDIKFKNKLIYFRRGITEVLILKENRSLRSNLQIQNKLKTIIEAYREDKPNEYIFSQFLYYENLLEEFIVTENEEVFEKAATILDEILNPLGGQQAYPIQIYVNILKSKSLLSIGKVVEAREILDFSLNLSKNIDNPRLFDAIEEELRNIDKVVSKWSELLTENQNLISNIKITGILEYLTSVSQKISRL